MIARPPLFVPLLAILGFLVLAGLTLGDGAPLDGVDAAVSEVFRRYGEAHPTLVAVLRVVTDVGAGGALLATGLLVAVALAGRREWRPAAFCLLIVGGVPLLSGLMHGLIHHPRPEAGFVVVDSNGFPSGHTSNAAAAGLAAILLLWPRVGSTGRVVTLALASAVGIFVGLTRVALLAHWPSDVLGGWLLALAVVPLAARLMMSRPIVGSGVAAERASRTG